MQAVDLFCVRFNLSFPRLILFVCEFSDEVCALLDRATVRRQPSWP